MTTTTTAESAHRTAATSDSEILPCVQYGFPEGEGPARSPKLRTISEPIPEGAITASPVYVVPQERYEYQRHLDEPYRLSGEYNSIATEVQDECEDDDQMNRVLYPVHIESDAYHEEGPETLIGWFHEFVEDYLDVPFHTCTLYFSGHRSIHVHVPRFVSGEDDREQLKELAATFCDETSADLDLGLYSRKRLFRLPGVEHEKTTLSKVEIEAHWDHSRIFAASRESDTEVPATYESVLRRVFASQESLTVGTAQPSENDPQNLFRILDSDKTVLEFDSEEREIETPLIERESKPTDKSLMPKWAQYNSHEFSPYANAAGNPRSVAALRVKGGAFVRDDKRSGWNQRIAALVPAFFYGAVGCDGEFTKDHVHAPLQLSKTDYAKWNATPGDTIVIIGGRSGSSRILHVTGTQARVIGNVLFDERGGRQEALVYLQSEGYEVGTSGSKCSSSSSGDSTPDASPPTESKRIYPARNPPHSEAERLQLQAERDGLQTLTHPERAKVACRHLRQGWSATWDWFKEHDSDFKPGVTWRQLRGLVEEYEEYNHIEVPSKPV